MYGQIIENFKIILILCNRLSSSNPHIKNDVWGCKASFKNLDITETTKY